VASASGITASVSVVTLAVPSSVVASLCSDSVAATASSVEDASAAITSFDCSITADLVPSSAVVSSAARSASVES